MKFLSSLKQRFSIEDGLLSHQHRAKASRAIAFGLTSVTFASFTALLGQPSFAADASFFCGISPEGTPTTYAKTQWGDRPMIRWVSWTLSGYSPLQRCKEVSGRFQTYRNNGTLRYITTGFMNNRPVVCVSSQNGGGCQGLLFTLKPNESASRVVQRLFDLGEGAAASPLFESSGSGGDASAISLDVDQLVNSKPAEVSRPLTGGTRPPAAAPQKPVTPPSAGGGRLW
jgi:hypothetical protein